MADVKLCQIHLFKTVKAMNTLLPSRLSIRVLLLAFMFVLMQTNSKADPSIYDRLDHAREPPLTAASNKKDAAILRKVASLPAQNIIPSSKSSDFEPSFEVVGSLGQYIESVVSNDDKAQTHVAVGFVPCAGNVSHRCAAVSGDACRHSTSETCEGMTLFVSVDITNGYTFDRAIGGGYYVIKSLEDLEELRAEAP